MGIVKNVCYYFLSQTLSCFYLIISPKLKDIQFYWYVTQRKAATLTFNRLKLFINQLITY